MQAIVENLKTLLSRMRGENLLLTFSTGQQSWNLSAGIHPVALVHGEVAKNAIERGKPLVHRAPSTPNWIAFALSGAGVRWLKRKEGRDALS